MDEAVSKEVGAGEGAIVGVTLRARPRDNHKQRNRVRFSPTVAALPPESLGALFDAQWELRWMRR